MSDSEMPSDEAIEVAKNLFRMEGHDSKKSTWRIVFERFHKRAWLKDVYVLIKGRAFADSVIGALVKSFALELDAFATQREQAAYERGKAEERARIEARLQAKRNWDEAIAENGFVEGDSPHRVAANRIAVQVWDVAINIVNQTE